MKKLSHLHILVCIVCLTGYNDASPQLQNNGIGSTNPQNHNMGKDLTDVAPDSKGQLCLDMDKVKESNRLSTSALNHINIYASMMSDVHNVSDFDKDSRGSKTIERYNSLVKELKEVIYQWEMGSRICYNIKYTSTLSNRFNTDFSVNFDAVEEFVQMKEPSPETIILINYFKSSGYEIPDTLMQKILNDTKYRSTKKRVMDFLLYLQEKTKIMEKHTSYTYKSLSNFHSKLLDNKGRVKGFLLDSETNIEEINNEVEKLSEQLNETRADIFSEVNADLKQYENMKSEELRNALKKIEAKINEDMYRDIAISAGVGIGGALMGPIAKYAAKHITKVANKLGSESLKALKQMKKTYVANKVPEGAGRVKKYITKKLAKFTFPYSAVRSAEVDAIQRAYLGLKIGSNALSAGSSIAAFSYYTYSATQLANKKIIKEQLQLKIDDAVQKEIDQAKLIENIKNLQKIGNLLVGLDTEITILKPFLINSIEGVKQLRGVFSALQNQLTSLYRLAEDITSTKETNAFVKNELKNLKNCWSNIHSRTTPLKYKTA